MNMKTLIIQQLNRNQTGQKFVIHVNLKIMIDAEAAAVYWNH